jgi:hypothetical protein
MIFYIAYLNYVGLLLAHGINSTRLASCIFRTLGEQCTSLSTPLSRISDPGSYSSDELRHHLANKEFSRRIDTYI